MTSGKHSSVKIARFPCTDRWKSRGCSKDYASSVWTAFACSTKIIFEEKDRYFTRKCSSFQTFAGLVGNAKIINFPRKYSSLSLDVLGILNSEFSLGMPHLEERLRLPESQISLGIQHFTPKNRQCLCKFKTGLTEVSEWYSQS